MKSAAESTVFSTNKTLNVRGRLLDVSSPKIMGILNVTPDSFYDGGHFTAESTVLKQTEKMLVEGADIIDVGGYSSRPGADDISVQEELNRSIPTIRAIVKNFPEAIVSIDTFRSEIARAAIEEGASVINDISAGELDQQMLSTVASLQVPYVIMHMKGNPQTMAQLNQYENLLKEIIDYFHKKIATLQHHGVKDIIIDPGFGFAKNVEQNFEMLSRLNHFKILGKPILVGLSRKSMIWRTLCIKPDEALNGTTVLNTIALLKGANILRVHDVKEAAEVLKLVSTLS